MNAPVRVRETISGSGRAAPPGAHRADRSVIAAVSRNTLFAGLVLVGIANALTERVTGSILSDGPMRALLATFGISSLVWIAAFIGVVLLQRGPPQPASVRDLVVAGAAAIAFLLPSSLTSWVTLTGLTLYLARTSPADSPAQRGAVIVLALTVPYFWSRVSFAILSDYILQFDALLVSSLIGTARVGNAIQTADGAGLIWIAPGCSSLANVSLAILCWVLFTRGLDRVRSRSDLLWCLLAAGSVIAVNVTRIALIGIEPDSYDILHGPVGSTVAGWLTLALMVGLCAFGVRRDLLARA